MRILWTFLPHTPQAALDEGLDYMRPFRCAEAVTKRLRTSRQQREWRQRQRLLEDGGADDSGGRTGSDDEDEGGGGKAERGLPVRWLVVSDSTWLKQRVAATYRAGSSFQSLVAGDGANNDSGDGDDRVLMVEIDTQHISKLSKGASRVDAIFSTFIEWYQLHGPTPPQPSRPEPSSFLASLVRCRSQAPHHSPGV